DIAVFDELDMAVLNQPLGQAAVADGVEDVERVDQQSLAVRLPIRNRIDIGSIPGIGPALQAESGIDTDVFRIQRGIERQVEKGTVLDTVLTVVALVDELRNGIDDINDFQSHSE